MESIKNLLNLDKIKRWTEGKPEWKKFKFVSHGLGTMRVEEHEDLLRVGAIKCDGETDTILANYPKLVIMHGQEKEYLDLGGNLFQLQQEMGFQQKKGVKCHIEFFPKSYLEYYEQKRSIEKAKDHEREAVDSLVQSFGGEVI